MVMAKLMAMLGMDASHFKAGMKGAKKETSSFQKDIKNIGDIIKSAFTVTAIAGMTKSLASWAGNATDAAASSGVLMTEMLALQQASLSGGLGLDGMTKMLIKLQERLNDAISGNAEAIKSFEDLGLSVYRLSGMAPAQMLLGVAKAAMASKNPLRALANLFGEKIGPKAMTAIRDMTGPDGLAKIGEEAVRAANEIDKLGDKFDVLTEKVKRWAVQKIGVAIEFYEDMAVRNKAEREQRRKENAKSGAERGYAQMGPFGAASTGEWNVLNKDADKRIKAAGDAAVADLYAKRKEGEKQRAKDQQDVIESNRKRLLEKEEEYKTKTRTKQAEDNEKKKKADDDRKKANDAFMKKWEDYYQREADIEAAAKERGDRINERKSALTNPSIQANASQINPDSMARVGGFFGGERSGYDVASKTLEIQREMKELIKEGNKNTSEMLEALERNRGTI